MNITTILQRLGMLTAMLLTILPASAETFKVDGVHYSVISDTDLTCSVDGVDSDFGGDLIIPSEVSYNSQTFKVTEISYSAFEGCNSVRLVVIPSSVTKVNGCAFEECVSLESVVIPSSVTKIEGATFDGCTSLASVVIPSSVTAINDQVFQDCISLPSIDLPSSLVWLGDQVFERCTLLESLEVPSSVTATGRRVFQGCTSLRHLTLSNSLKVIEYGLFKDCSALESLTIPGGVDQIILSGYDYGVDYEYSTFDGCVNLKELTFDYSEKVLNTTVGNTEDYETGFYVDFEQKKYLPIEKLTIDRPLKNDIILPSLKELTLGEHVDKVQVDCSECENLIFITSHTVLPPTVGEFTDAQYRNVVVKVPEEALEAYKTADGWKNFWNIQSLGTSGVEEVSNGETVYEIGRYDLNGMVIGSEYEGIVIVRYSDGSTKKLLNRK